MPESERFICSWQFPGFFYRIEMDDAFSRVLFLEKITYCAILINVCILMGLSRIQMRKNDVCFLKKNFIGVTL